jgi:hypothetical protein
VPSKVVGRCRRCCRCSALHVEQERVTVGVREGRRARRGRGERCRPLAFVARE